MIYGNISDVDLLGIDRVLRRGSGEILVDSENILFVRDSVSNAFFLACKDREAGLALLDGYSGTGCDLLAVTDYETGLEAFERYGYSEKLECYQVAYFGEKPRPGTGLTVRTAGEGDFPMLTESYRMISPEELAKVVARGDILIGFYQGRPVGFVGEHLEGSMGLLYVFPEYRRRGFGTLLQMHQIARTMEAGFIPFGQVEKDNLKSLNLQKKLGMTVSDNLIVWMWK